MNIIGSSSRFGSYIACDRQPILASGAASDRYVPRSALSPSKRSSLHVSVQRNVRAFVRIWHRKVHLIIGHVGLLLFAQVAERICVDAVLCR